MKRIVDLPMSILLLVLLAPVFLIVSLLIYCVSPGKVVYVQERLGRGGKVFKCYKFRTMRKDADLCLRKVLRQHLHLQEEWTLHQKLKNDPRVFTLGKFLRKFSIDELPQVWNVVKGDLSLVGPRPYMVKQRELLGNEREKILSVRPGMTGLWQTSGRNRMTFEERVIMDASYVDRRSMWLDLKLIAKTVPVVLFNDDAF